MEDVNLGNLITGVWIILITIGPQINFTVVLRDGKMSLKSTIYRILSLSDDIEAIRKGKIGKRLANKAIVKAVGKLMRRWDDCKNGELHTGRLERRESSHPRANRHRQRHKSERLAAAEKL
jgi:hypothetical protein